MYGWRRVFARTLVAAVAVAGTALVGAEPAHADGGFGLGIDLGSLYGGASVAWSINSGGTIAGTSDGLPVMWVNRQIHLLPLPAGFTGGTVRDINDSGVGVGHVWNDDGAIRAVRWDGLNSVSLLEDNAPGGSGAYGINNAGLITGFADFADGTGRIPVRYASGKAQFLDPRDVPGTGYTISRLGQVFVGNEVTGGVQHAFEVGLGRGGYMQLPSIVCCGPSAAWAVSNYGNRIFGNSDAGNGRSHPTMWLSSLGPNFTLTWKAWDLDPNSDWDGYVNDSTGSGSFAVGTEVNTRGAPGAPQGASIPVFWQKWNRTPLVDPGGSGSCDTRGANGINDSLTVVGYGCTADQAVHAMLWQGS